MRKNVTVNKCACGADSDITLNITKIGSNEEIDEGYHYCLECYEAKLEADNILRFPLDDNDGWDDE